MRGLGTNPVRARVGVKKGDLTSAARFDSDPNSASLNRMVPIADIWLLETLIDMKGQSRETPGKTECFSNLVCREFGRMFFPHSGRDHVKLSFVEITKDSRTVWIRRRREHEPPRTVATVYANSRTRIYLTVVSIGALEGRGTGCPTRYRPLVHSISLSRTRLRL